MAKFSSLVPNHEQVAAEARALWEAEHGRPLAVGFVPFEGSQYDPRSPQQIAEARQAAWARTVR